MQVVTPSRVCELKSRIGQPPWSESESHTLTGVWVEIVCRAFLAAVRLCHTLTGVWVEIFPCISSTFSACHTLTGVWVEISLWPGTTSILMSHPHGCVSWNGILRTLFHIHTKSHPHGCVSWNWFKLSCHWVSLSHTLTGVWVETASLYTYSNSSRVTPSRVCELKHMMTLNPPLRVRSHPHGCVSWNDNRDKLFEAAKSHTLTGVWVETKRLQKLPCIM